MNVNLFILVLVSGLVSALPTKTKHKTQSTRKNTVANGGLGIYDGKSTTIAKHNYLAGILVEGVFYCAGAIVSDSYVITLGDCTVDLTASSVTVVVGSSDGIAGTSYPVKKIITHPSYEELELSYDFSLLKVKGTFSWGDDVGNVTLPSADPKSGAALVAVGWGDTSALGSVAEGSLLQGTMKYVTGSDCESYYADYDVTFDSSMACAYNKGKTTMCQNDFGDPFTKGNVLYGLMADGGGSGEFCNADAIPVIIADVYAVVDWINEYL